MVMPAAWSRASSSSGSRKFSISALGEPSKKSPSRFQAEAPSVSDRAADNDGRCHEQPTNDGRVVGQLVPYAAPDRSMDLLHAPDEKLVQRSEQPPNAAGSGAEAAQRSAGKHPGKARSRP